MPFRSLLPRGNRLVQDPVHGEIHFDDVERAVIDTVHFQRLRYVKQTGLLHYVFPGATHTRFAHSIGTMHNAGRVFHRLLHSTLHAAHDRPRNLSDDQAQGIRFLWRAFRLAALLHDVGHGAFSHSLERAIRPNGERILGDATERLHQWGFEELAKAATKKGVIGEGSALSHEIISLAIIEHLLIDSTPENDRIDEELMKSGMPMGTAGHLGRAIQSLIVPGLGVPDYFAEQAAELLGFLHSHRDQLVYPEAWHAVTSERFGSDLHAVLSSLISGTIDVDRMDYLLRDSFHCGTAVGNYSLEFLVRCLVLAPTVLPGSGSDPQVVLTVDQKGRSAVEEFLLSRFYHYRNVINHKTSAAYEIVLLEVLAEVIARAEEDGEVSPFALSELTSYLSLTDDYVMSRVLLRSLKRSSKRDMTNFLGRRDVLHMLMEETFTPWHEEQGAFPGFDSSYIEQLRATARKKFKIPKSIGNDQLHVVKSRVTLMRGGPAQKLPPVILNAKVRRRGGGPVVEDFLDGAIAVGGQGGGPGIPAWIEVRRVFVQHGVREQIGHVDETMDDGGQEPTPEGDK